MRINHNISALNAYRNLSVNTSNTAKSLEKLSSGLRINKASDDAAGLAISEKMRSQIRGLQMAERNALDGISLIQTGEGALSSVHEILQRMRELAVQSANDSYTDNDRAEIQKEINQLTSEVNRIGNATEFNTATLLDGSRINSYDANGKKFPEGTHTYNAETGVGLTITNSDELTLGKNTLSISKTQAGLADPEDITEASIAGPNFANDKVGVTTDSTDETWTLTLNEIKTPLFANGETTSTISASGVTASIADADAVSAGTYTGKVTAELAGKKFEGKESPYTLGAAKLTVSGNGDYEFAENKIAYDVSGTGGEPYPSGTVTIEYVNGTTFKVYSDNNVIDDQELQFGTPYTEHGLNFTLEKLAPGQKISFEISGDNDVINTDPYSIYEAPATANLVFAKDITVDNSVETGEWTIEKLSTGWKAEFKNEANQITVSDQFAYPGTYNNHGISFEFTSASLAEGEKITFKTKAADTYNDYKVELTNGTDTETVTILNVKEGSPVALDASFNGINFNAANLKGDFSFTIQENVVDEFTLSNEDGSKTATLRAGENFNQFGLDFTIEGRGSLTDGASATFTTEAPKPAYEYKASLNGADPVTVVSGVAEGNDPEVSFFPGLPGLELDSAALKVGSFEFEVEEAGTGKDNSLKFQIGANAGQMVAVEINDMRGSALQIAAEGTGGEKIVTLLDGTEQKVWFTEVPGSTDGVSDENVQYALDVSSHEKAQAAITVLSDAIQRVSSERARLGSIQNRLEHTVDNLKIMNENITSSESRIRDLDMAMEMTNFTKDNILNQAAQAMLAQANQLPQGVLQLLQ